MQNRLTDHARTTLLESYRRASFYRWASNRVDCWLAEKDMKKSSLFNFQFSSVIDGGASRNVLLQMLRRRRLRK
jgi:hypothetical protein